MLSKLFMNTRIYSLLLAIVVISSCKKPDEFPDEPVITFKSIYTELNPQGYDSKLFVILNFTDGDGDIGYNQIGYNDVIFDDPSSPYYNNFQVKTFQLINGGFVEDTTNLSARMMYITPEVKNKSLKGEIQRELPVPPNVNDTFRFEIFIYDRALHASNVVVTPDIILHTQ
jgi:hypothetical protein